MKFLVRIETNSKHVVFLNLYISGNFLGQHNVFWSWKIKSIEVIFFKPSGSFLIQLKLETNWFNASGMKKCNMNKWGNKPVLQIK